MAQETAFGDPPGDDVEDWKQVLGAPASGGGDGDGTVQDLLLDVAGLTVTSCTAVCMPNQKTGCCDLTLGTANHLSWPNTREPDMLAFMKANPLP
jgi:hypothetical protein